VHLSEFHYFNDILFWLPQNAPAGTGQTLPGHASRFCITAARLGVMKFRFDVVISSVTAAQPRYEYSTAHLLFH
jgi:hypothetical protein